MCKHLKGTLRYWERFTCFFTENIETQMSRGPVGHHRWVRFSVQNECFHTPPGDNSTRIYVQGGAKRVFTLTSCPCTMRWCVVIRALKTTTQLALPTLSISVSTIWGTFTLVWSWVAWIRSGEEMKFSEGAEHKLIKQEDRWDGKTEAWQRCKRGAASSGHCCTTLAFPLSVPQAKHGRLGFIYSELLLEAAVFRLKCIQGGRRKARDN